ncbi:hypothetical protein KIN20_021177 [Parelaphostrongylus tenuis]|uniref:Uncharacterized protein n=1 Tax=Parelaphostrongylus tenuis TaxID=148309 RepID=A0AAD5QUB8_PARTN|nr:hypothetical protein KIN20_021177 [Parelaphostrongylus tenuis]
MRRLMTYGSVRAVQSVTFSKNTSPFSAHSTKPPLLGMGTADVVLAPREQGLANFHSQSFATDDDRSVLADAIRANVSHKVEPIDHGLCGDAQ